MATIATARRELERLKATLRANKATPLLDELRRDPALILSRAGLAPDPWQARLLRSRSRRALLLCSRQSGKSLTAAALALRAALFSPGSLVLLLSPTLRQSGELFKDKMRRLFTLLGRPAGVRQESALQMELTNGSRVIALPGEEGTVRGFSGVALLVVDEASRVPDALYYSIRPMLAVSGGQLVCLSTPFGQRGWFYEEWERGQGWERVLITADECPRITPEFLAEERLAMGERWFKQEYLCSFEEAVGAVFAAADIERAFSGDVRPLFYGT